MTFGPYRLKDVYVSGDNLVLALEDKDGTVYRPQRKLRYSDTEAEQRKAEALKGSMVTTETYDPSKWPATEWWTSISAYTTPSQRRLHALRVGNFKAFADTQRIPLKPITLIFGPNSAGKSSFIHSLALAHEAQFGRDKRGLARLDVHHTEIGGNSIDLGGFRQYVHRGQASKRVEWGAELRVSALHRTEQRHLAELLAPVATVALNITLGIELDDQERPRPGAEPRVDAVEISGDGVELLRMSRRPTSKPDDTARDTLRLDRLTSDHAVFRQVLETIVTGHTTSDGLHAEDEAGLAEAIADLLPQLVIYPDPFFPSGVKLPDDDSLDSAARPTLFPLSKGNRREDLAKAVRFWLPRTLDALVKGVADALAGELKQLRYLGPLRSFPPRHLAFAEHEDANWYAGGGYAWDVVRRDDAVRAQDAPILDASQGKLEWIVLDEAHNYVGSQAAELALLLRRVLHAFGTNADRVHFVATSATIGTGDATARRGLQEFLSRIAGVSPERVVVVEGERFVPPISEAIAGAPPRTLDELELADADAAGTYRRLCIHPVARRLRDLFDPRVSGQSYQPLTAVAEALRSLSEPSDDGASLRWLDLLTSARTGEGREAQSFLPLRLHAFHNTLNGLWACVNPACSGKHGTALVDPAWPFGRLFLEERNRCPCSSPVYAVSSCDDCNETFLAAELVSSGGAQRLVPAVEDDPDEFSLDRDPDEAEPVEGEADAEPELQFAHRTPALVVNGETRGAAISALTYAFSIGSIRGHETDDSGPKIVASGQAD